MQDTFKGVRKVSIQLMSPASGDDLRLDLRLMKSLKVSIQLMSPASGDENVYIMKSHGGSVSIQLMSPASGDLGSIWISN